MQVREFQSLVPAGLPEDLYLYDVEGKFLFPVITPNGLATACFVYLVKAGQGPGVLNTELGHVPGEIVYHGNGWMTCGVEFKLSDSLQQKKEKLESAIYALGASCQS
jgi:hypothetical protein